MKNKEKKVIILENLSSPFISQAIIILKDGSSPSSSNIIEEAEKIVSGYFPQNNKKNSPKNNHKAIFWGMTAIVSIICLVICIRVLS